MNSWKPFELRFLLGDVPGDEPPGFTEIAYRQWKAAGGKPWPWWRRQAYWLRYYLLKLIGL